jgi:hypothetical protein
MCPCVEAVVLLRTSTRARLILGSEASANRWSEYRDHVPLTSGPARRYDVTSSWATVNPDACAVVAVPIVAMPSSRCRTVRLSPGILKPTHLG